MLIEYTKHAEDMLRERQLDKCLVESAVREPDCKEDSNTGLQSIFKRVGARVLRVVLKNDEKCQIVITAYYDRRQAP